MKKTLLLFASCLISNFTYAQNTIIPDPNFEQALIDLGYDSGEVDGSVLTANINSITFLDVSYKSISDLTGIQDFVGLTTLYSRDNDLATLDISNNTNLISLAVLKNTLTNLDISANINMQRIYCSENNLTTLDTSNNPNLKILTANDNQISDLDLSSNSDLLHLTVANNNLSDLDLSSNSDLSSLTAPGNQLSELDLSNNTYLSNFDASGNSLTSLNIKNGFNLDIITFKVSNNPDLECVQVDDVDYSNSTWTDKDEQTIFKLDCSEDLGVKSIFESSLSIYPNPSDGNLSIDLIRDSKVSIYTLLGQKIQQENLKSGKNKLNLNLEKGVYILQIHSKGEVINKKISIK